MDTDPLPIETTPAIPAAGGGADGQTPVGSVRAVPLMMLVLVVLALLYTLAMARTLVVPLVLASFLGVGLNPLVLGVSRLHIPRALSALIVMLALGAGLASAVTLLTPAAVEWLQQAPSAIRHDLAPRLRPLTLKLQEANRATQSLTGTLESSAQAVSDKPGLDFWDVVSVTPSILAFTVTVALLVFFFLIYGDRMLLKLVEISPSFGRKRDVVSIVRGIQSKVSRYLLTCTAINLTLGVVSAGAFWWLGLSDPMLWGALVALANYIPYVGAVSMGIVLALVGIMQFHVLAPALAPAAVFALLSAIEGNLITPLVMGRSMRLSPVAILIWLLVWAWLWGIAGALLAVPMLVTLKLIAERIEGWRWLAHLVGR